MDLKFIQQNEWCLESEQKKELSKQPFSDWGHPDPDILNCQTVKLSYL